MEMTVVNIGLVVAAHADYHVLITLYTCVHKKPFDLWLEPQKCNPGWKQAHLSNCIGAMSDSHSLINPQQGVQKHLLLSIAARYQHSRASQTNTEVLFFFSFLAVRGVHRKHTFSWTRKFINSVGSCIYLSWQLVWVPWCDVRVSPHRS